MLLLLLLLLLLSSSLCHWEGGPVAYYIYLYLSSFVNRNVQLSFRAFLCRCTSFTNEVVHLYTSFVLCMHTPHKGHIYVQSHSYIHAVQLCTRPIIRIYISQFKVMNELCLAKCWTLLLRYNSVLSDVTAIVGLRQIKIATPPTR